MSTRVVDRVDEWRERPLTDGHRSLHELADEGFSGAVRAGEAELYMAKGTVVGIRRGEIEDFDDSGTAYTAPSPALPLLAVMQETNDEVRAEYYSEKTAISEVDATLSDGAFTGYIELSDNVLSGDYYQVYHAGQSMSVGFIGEATRLIDGDEAFETADDEVGIYQVCPAEIEITELPAVPDEPTGNVDTADDTETVEHSDDVPADDADNDETADDTEPTDTTATADHAEADEQPPGSADEKQSGGASETTTATATVEQSAAKREPRTQNNEQQAATSRKSVPKSQGARQAARAKQRGTEQQEQSHTRQRSRSSGDETDVALETRAIPSLDPEQTVEPDESGGNPRDTLERTAETTQGGRSGNAQAQRSAGSEARASTEEQAQPTDHESAQAGRESAATSDQNSAQSQTGDQTKKGATQSPDSGRIEELEEKIADRDEEIDRLNSELDRKTTEYEDAKSQLETVRQERDELEEELEELQGELDRLETELGAATDAERRITSAEALAGTDVFPRYASKGDATLEKAHGGSHRRDDVLDNLRLEQNTQFDANTVAVGGQEYAEFLESTLEYRFVNWIVGNLLFEIRETGHKKPLKDLYDALPVVDWADLKGTVDVVYNEDGQETRSEESFDIVLRSRMGEPLIVANLNDSREGATKSMMENLIRSAGRVGQTSDAFAGAFLVTRSFFEPSALETADDATKSGLFSRSKRKSFVNLSRKQGYHLCLVEARNDNFTLLVPEL